MPVLLSACCSGKPFRNPGSRAFNLSTFMQTLRIIQKSKSLYIPVSSIKYISGNGGPYTVVHTLEDKHIIAKPFSVVQEQLPEFVRVNRSVLVNPSIISKVFTPNKNRSTVTLQDGTKIKIPRRKASAFKAAYAKEGN